MDNNNKSLSNNTNTNDKDKIQHSVEQTLLALVTSFEKESEERNSELLGNLLDAYMQNEALYDCEINLAFLNFSRFASFPYKSTHKITDKKNSYIIDLMYNGTFEHFIRRYIENNEGSPCSGDKTHFIIKMVKKAIETGENQDLYRTYEGCEQIPKEDWNKQAYWSPKTIKDTDAVIKMFWDWYNVN